MPSRIAAARPDERAIDPVASCDPKYQRHFDFLRASVAKADCTRAAAQRQREFIAKEAARLSRNQHWRSSLQKL
eukprot:4320390-Pyramimonas_sp.AAC.1